MHGICPWRPGRPSLMEPCRPRIWTTATSLQRFTIAAAGELEMQPSASTQAAFTGGHSWHPCTLPSATSCCLQHSFCQGHIASHGISSSPHKFAVAELGDLTFFAKLPAACCSTAAAPQCHVHACSCCSCLMPDPELGAQSGLARPRGDDQVSRLERRGRRSCCQQRPPLHPQLLCPMGPGMPRSPAIRHVHGCAGLD